MIKRMIAATCPGIDLSGDYPEIMPQVTTEQLGQLLDVVEGNGAPVWSWLAALFLQYGQKEAVAAHRDRLVLLVKWSGDAVWALVEVPHLTDKTRDALVKRVTDSRDADWLLRNAPNLNDEQRDILHEVIHEPLRQS